MMRLFGRFCISGITALLCFSMISCQPNAQQTLQSELNSSGWNLLNPAGNWVYPGGIFVQEKKILTFYGLPEGASRLPTGPLPPPGAAWGQNINSESFSVVALLNGIGSILGTSIGGGVTYSKSSQETAQEIDASGMCVLVSTTSTQPPQCGMDVGNLLTEAPVSKQIKAWLQNKNAGYSVYVVTKVASTSSLSVTTSSSNGVSAVFLVNLPQCPPPNQPSGSVSPAGGAASAGGSGSGNAPATGGTAGTATTTSTAGSPTVSLQACKVSSSQFTLNTSAPLVFAVEAVQVNMDQNGNLQTTPVAFTMAHPIQPIQPKPAIVKGRWQLRPWPVNQ